jgi:hypothetical protein
MATITAFTKQLAAASSNAIALSQSPGTAALTLNGAAVSGGIATIDTATAANLAIGRRVIITSGGNDSGITWAVVGTNSTGNRITDTVTGSNGGAAQSNLDFVTITSITPSAAVATTAIAGTNGVGSSPWVPMNFLGQSPMNIGMAVELVSGTATFSVQHTFDDPNNLPPGVSYPLPFNSALITGATATAEGSYSTPLVAVRLLITTGTGALRARFVQAGVG